MESMRQLISLVEGPKKPRKVVIDTSGFKTSITTLMRKFSNTSFHIRMNREWADKATQIVTQYKASLEPEDLPYFDAQDYLKEMAQKVWHDGKDQLIAVRANVEHEIHEYQIRAAERHGRLDDLDFHIESSDFLMGMEAMQRCASDLSTMALDDPASMQRGLQRLDSFIDVWENSLYGGDGGEQPMLDENFTEVIGKMLPLLLLLYS